MVGEHAGSLRCRRASKAWRAVGRRGLTRRWSPVSVRQPQAPPRSKAGRTLDPYRPLFRAVGKRKSGVRVLRAILKATFIHGGSVAECARSRQISTSKVKSSKSELEIASLVSSVDRAILTAVLRNRLRVRVPHGALLFSYCDKSTGPVLDMGAEQVIQTGTNQGPQGSIEGLQEST